MRICSVSRRRLIDEKRVDSVNITLKKKKKTLVFGTCFSKKISTIFECEVLYYSSTHIVYINIIINSCTAQYEPVEDSASIERIAARVRCC